MTQHDSGVCAAIREQLADFMDGELAAPLATEVSGHLAECEACRTALALERSVMDELRREVHAVRMPAALRDRLWAALRQAAERELPAAAPEAGTAPVSSSVDGLDRPRV